MRCPPARAAPRPLRVSLRAGLVAFSLVAIALTAAAAHPPCRQVSRGSVAEMARQLNAGIGSGVGREVAALFHGALAAQRAVRWRTACSASTPTAT